MAMLTDLYELTMSAAYFENKMQEIATFDLFIREMPKNRGYLIACGLEQVVDYLQNINFNNESLDYLRQQGIFKENFLNYLKNFKFTGELHAIPEGTVVFPKEPLLRVTAPIIQAQLIETYLLNTIVFQTLIASKASRVVNAAGGKEVIDFSLRRVHGADAGIKGSRASYIAGCIGTSNVLAGMVYRIPIYGTIAHSFIMAHECEMHAFRNYTDTFPDKCLLLIDTYDTLEAARGALIIAKELERLDKKMIGVRIDSGDILKLSREIRKMFDKAGYKYLKIFASGDLDEYKIEELLKKGAPIDMFGVGTAMGTSRDQPVLNGNYKLVEVTNRRGEVIPRIKLSQGKKTFPGKKQVYRVYEKGIMSNDILALEGEPINSEPLLEQVIKSGKLVKELPKFRDIRERCKNSLAKLPEEYKKLVNPPAYKVELSSRLKKLMNELTEKYTRS